MLYIVPTPIGNLNDISKRALDVLRQVDLIACEDTRQTLKLLSHYQIKKPLVSYHQHSKITKLDQLVNQLKTKDIALVSDAGTPAISDPGHLLVQKAHQNKIQVISIPGPSALITALAGSGFNLASFSFLGFLPHKKGRQTILKNIQQNKKSVFAFYESTHRIIKLLNELNEYMPGREICLARELTKIYEEFLRGQAKKILITLEKYPEKQKGEFVVIINSI